MANQHRRLNSITREKGRTDCFDSSTRSHPLKSGEEDSTNARSKKWKKSRSTRKFHVTPVDWKQLYLTLIRDKYFPSVKWFRGSGKYGHLDSRRCNKCNFVSAKSYRIPVNLKRFYARIKTFILWYFMYIVLSDILIITIPIIMLSHYSYFSLQNLKIIFLSDRQTKV